jgi:uncharacterized protein with NAD-binding domain and iron-sulfur cluster
VTAKTLKDVVPGRLPAKRVVVIGAGVAGLTAAHELVERGYEVEVVEARRDRQAPDVGSPTPLLGGLARTSWALVPQPESQVPLKIAVGQRPADPQQNGNRSKEGFRRLLAIEDDKLPLPVVDPLPQSPQPGDTFVPSFAFQSVVDEYRKERNRRLSFIAVVQKAPSDATSIANSLGGSHGAILLRKWIETKLEKEDVFSLSVIAATGNQEYVQVALQNDRVPGEHGYRFFPSFYSHMFDTMRRIPIPEASLDTSTVQGTVLQADSSRSVFDNLVRATTLELAYRRRDGRDRAFALQRTPAQSLEVVRRLVANLLEKAGYRGQDLARVTTRYLEYLTSCPERRWHEYEDMTWADFLGLDSGYSPYFATSMKGSAQALVAMSASKSDARTIGSVSMQLVLDQTRVGPCVDGILNGPTTTALFDPWQTYLASEGVTFTCGKLVGFVGDDMAVRPVFAREAAGGWEVAPVAPADFYVIAIPMTDFQQLFDDEGRPTGTGLSGDARYLNRQELERANEDNVALDEQERTIAKDESRNDLRKYLAFKGVKKVHERPDKGPLRYMCGVQFFFGAGVNLVEGHSICVDSPWGVSFLSQMQYWQDRQRGDDGVRAVISAVFTRFETEAKDRDGDAKKALECTPEELADRVWTQIRSTWDVARLGRLPQPEYFFVDENLEWRGTRLTNKQPYLVNDVGTWEKRGGARTKDGDYVYCLQLGHTVFAGSFMRTTTRLNTMEAANETGRRAVNAILDADGSEVPRCQLWNMETDEAPDLLQLRDLDRRVYRRGGRHILRASTIDAWLRATPWDLARLALPTYDDEPGGQP